MREKIFVSKSIFVNEWYLPEEEVQELDIESLHQWQITYELFDKNGILVWAALR